MMKMYNPPHPGEIIKGLWLDPMGASITDAAQAMGVSRKTLSKIVNGRGRVTPEIALRLSVALGTVQKAGWDIKPPTICGRSNNTKTRCGLCRFSHLIRSPPTVA